MKHRKNSTARYLRQETGESLQGMFLIAVAGIIVCLILDNAGTIPLLWRRDIEDISVLYYLYYAVNGGFYGLFVIPAIAALPYGLGYFRDRQAGIVRTVISKTGIKTYCAGKMTGAFLSGSLSCVCGMGMFSLFVSYFHPWGTRNLAVEYEGMPFNSWIVSGQYVRYFLLRVFLYGIWCGLWCLVALCISGYVKNAYVILASVTVILFAFNTLNNVCNVNVCWRPSSWFSGSYSLGSDGKTLLGCLLFAAFLLAFVWHMFYRKVRKNLYEG